MFWHDDDDDDDDDDDNNNNNNNSSSNSNSNSIYAFSLYLRQLEWNGKQCGNAVINRNFGSSHAVFLNLGTVVVTSAYEVITTYCKIN
jgi:hypothetical protein